jgi:hypothetical protein
MNLAVSPIASDMLKMTLLLQTLDSGRIMASVLEIPDCQAEAATKEEAIAVVNKLLSERFKQIEFATIEIPVLGLDLPKPVATKNPWKKIFGLFKDDPIFGEIAAELRAEREIEDDTEVDPSVYLQERA